MKKVNRRQPSIIVALIMSCTTIQPIFKIYIFKLSGLCDYVAT